jgi:mRNA interferase MazF
MKQYEVRWAQLPEPVGLRPVLLLTRSSAYAYLSKVLAAEVTTHIRGIPQEVALGKKDGLPRTCVAKLDNIHLVPTRSLGAVLAVLGASRHVDVKRALGHALFWPELQAL